MKKVLPILLSVLMIFALIIPAFAEEEMPPFLYDEAKILSDTEFEKLDSLLTEKSEKLQFTIAIVIVNESKVNDDNIEAYTDDTYDYNGYGYGANHNGCLLLINMYDRAWHITGTGSGVSAINNEAIYIIFDQMKEDLANDNYYDAFVTYANTVEKAVGYYKDGKPLTDDTRKEYGYAEPFKLSGKGLIISFIVALVISLVIGSMIKSKYKPVRLNANAQDYLVPGSLNLINQYDNFLYTTVSSVRKQESSSSGGGSHTSSSGTSHSGGGGHF